MKTSLYERELLFRQAQKNFNYDKYVQKLACFLNEEIDGGAFLSLRQTDKIIDILSEKQVRQCEFLDLRSAAELVDFVERKTLDSGFYLLLDEEWRFCGAYKIEGRVRFNKNFDFNEKLSDEIRIIDLNFRFQMQIDYDSDEITCQYFEYG